MSNQRRSICDTTTISTSQLCSTSDDGSSSPDAQHMHTSSARQVGVANQAYFQPGPMNILPLRRIVIEQRMPPSLLTDKVLTSEEAVELFQLFFERCNPHCCILEPQIHTPTTIGSRSPFLFTAVCAVASKYYVKRKDLYLRCLHAAKRCAFDVLVKGYKSVEIVQALLLLSLWNQPAERFEEDRTWAFSGIAIRMATDLNLHRKTTAKLAPSVEESAAIQYEREILNRERTWLYCFITDRALSAQMGKPYTIREDWIIRQAKVWHKQRCSVPFDYGLMAMVDLHRKFARILDTLYSDSSSISGLNMSLDYSVLMRTFSYDLEQWFLGWEMVGQGCPDDQEGGYRHSMKEFYYNYYRLFTMSFMLQHALKNPDGALELSQVFVICYDAATRVIKVARNFLGPSGVLRYAPDSQFVYIAYAAVFMLKLIRPEFRPLYDEPIMLSLVQDVIALLEDLAVDETHTPALYATFLRVLVTSKQASTAPSRAELRYEDNGQQHHFDMEEIKSEGGGGGHGHGYGVEHQSKSLRQRQHPAPEDIESALRQRQLSQQQQLVDASSLGGGGAAAAGVLDQPQVGGRDKYNNEVNGTGNHLTSEDGLQPPQVLQASSSSSSMQQFIPPPSIPLSQSMVSQHIGDIGASTTTATTGAAVQFEQHDVGNGDMDNVLRDARFLDGFWESMLMPGYSGPLDGLSGGTGLVSHFQTGSDLLVGGYTFTPAVSGRTTPTHLFAQSSLDLGNVDYNPHHV